MKIIERIEIPQPLKGKKKQKWDFKKYDEPNNLIQGICSRKRYM